MKPKVVFAGAGPGDPELLTLRARREIEDADVIVYAGSLINRAVLDYAKDEAVLIDSHGKTREELIAIFERYVNAGKKVVRLHSGDLSFYSAIQEQMALLDSKRIEYELVPGVSSLSAASVSLKRELTSPGVSQTLIITKPSGKTGKPGGERIAELARHGATMVIFLGVHLIDEIVSELLAGYPTDTPVAVVHKASWREERIIEGTLADIAGKVKTAGFSGHSLIIVGDVLRHTGVSVLYSGTRDDVTVKRRDKRGIAIFSLAQKSVTIAERVRNLLLDRGYDVKWVCPVEISCDSADERVESIYRAIRDSFREHYNIIAILPMGILVRAIEPVKKTEDPWVVCIEENGRWVIPVLNGHRGANEFAQMIAEALSAEAVITTSERDTSSSTIIQ